MPVLSEGPADHEEGTFVLVPVDGEPGAQMAVFSDGSYARWYPAFVDQPFEP